MRFLFSAMLLLCGSPWAQTAPPRIIVFILDDVGSDTLAQLPTPNIDALAATGVRFSNAYAHAWCKISRDSLLRGVRNGIARSEACLPTDETALNADDPTFVDALHDAGFLTGLIGKWHLGNTQRRGVVSNRRPVAASFLPNPIPWWFAPRSVGFDHWWAGTASSAVGNCNPGFFNNVDDGVFSQSLKYGTIRQRDKLIELMDEAETRGQPLFAWVGFTDAHAPWGKPPVSIRPIGYVIPTNPTQRDLFEAEVVALDFVIGEICALLNPQDLVIVLSENGTPAQVTVPLTNRAKSTVYQRGVRVPMIFSGAGLGPMVIDDPVHIYDLPATLLSLVGIQGPTGDGRDLLVAPPPNPFVFVHNPSPTANQSRAVIERRYKLIENLGGLEFYDLLFDPQELQPLPQNGQHFNRLNARLAVLPSP